MRTRDELFRAAQREVAARRQRAVTRADAARREAVRRHPEIEQAEARRTRLGAAYLMASAQGAASDRCSAAKRAFEQAGRDVGDVIRAAGYDPAEFEPRFTCPLCRDTGVLNGKPCRCVAELTRALRREEINAASPLALCSFDSFDISRYPAEPDPDLGGPVQDYWPRCWPTAAGGRRTSAKRAPICCSWASAGLGKTHLALAIADAVLNRGFDVLYTSSAALAAQLSREHFDRDSDADWLDACKEADLLISGTTWHRVHDPPGGEHAVRAHQHPACSAAVPPSTPPTSWTGGVEARYTEKVASRMLGNCRMFKFFGTDQRLK